MFDVEWEALGTIIALAGLVGGLIGWLVSQMHAARARRADEIRRNEVHDWAKDAISALQKLSVITKYSKDEREDSYFEIAISTSILLEHGRLFFKNSESDHGKGKQPAFRGLRP